MSPGGFSFLHFFLNRLLTAENKFEMKSSWIQRHSFVPAAIFAAKNVHKIVNRAGYSGGFGWTLEDIGCDPGVFQALDIEEVGSEYQAPQNNPFCICLWKYEAGLTHRSLARKDSDTFFDINGWCCFWYFERRLCKNDWGWKEKGSRIHFCKLKK